MSEYEQSDRQNHGQIRPLLAVYRELDESQRRRVDAHVQTCPECSEQLAAFQEVDRQLSRLRDHHRVHLQADLQSGGPDLADFRSRREAAGRKGAPWQRLSLPLGGPLRLAAGLAGAALLVVAVALFVSWVASFSQTVIEREQSTPDSAAVAGLPRATQADVAAEQGSGGQAISATNLGRLAYVQDGDLWTKELPDGESQRLIGGGDNSTPRWSPLGQWLAFLKGGILWVVNVNAPEEAYSLQTTAAGNGSGFAWSPVADQLAFTAGNKLQLLETTTGAITTLVSLPGDGEDMYRVTHPFWKPDGTAIAYELYRVPAAGSETFQGDHGIWLIELEGSEPVELYQSNIPQQGEAILAGWSSDGRYLLFWQGDILSASLLMDGVPLYALPVGDVETTEPVALTVPAAGQAAAPMLARQDFLAPAPNSFAVSEIAITLGGGRDTWSNKRVGGASPQTGIWRSYTPEGQVSIAPAWSPDGQQLAFVTMPGNASSAEEAIRARRIEVLNSSGRHQLTGDPAYRDENPLWSAGSSHILFARVDEEDRASLWLIRAENGDAALQQAQKVVETLSPPPDTGWFGAYGYVDWGQHYDWWRSPLDQGPRPTPAPLLDDNQAPPTATFNPSTPVPPVESTPSPAAEGAGALEGTEWRLLEIERRESDLIEIFTVEEWALVTATFADGQIAGTTGCNQYGGPVTLGEASAGGPSMIAIGEVAMTAAECADPNLGRLEKMFVDALRAAEAFTMTGDRLTILLPDGELRFRALKPDDLTADERENEVVEALLAAWYGRRGDITYAIQNETAFNAPGVSLDETLEVVAAELGEPLDGDLLADFRQKNAAVHLLAGRLEIASPLTALDRVEASALLARGWDAFAAQYPNTPAFITLSRVGFDESGERALAYIGLRDSALAAGYYSLLTRAGGAWVETGSFQLWSEP